jgi:hypothetical protein
MALTPQDWGLFIKVYSFRSAVFSTKRVTSRRMWFFATHGRSCLQGRSHICLPWVQVGCPLQATVSPIGDRVTRSQTQSIHITPGNMLDSTTRLSTLTPGGTLQTYSVPYNGPRVEVEGYHYSFMTSALEGVGGQYYAPTALPPRKSPVPIAPEAGWASGPFWTVAKNLYHTGFRCPDPTANRQSLYRLSYPSPYRLHYSVTI